MAHPTKARKARIGDGRNDEDLIVAQLHLAFLHFHNEVLRWLDTHPDAEVPGDSRFQRARALVEWHYQWVTAHDLLKTIAHELGITPLTREELLVFPDPLSIDASPVDDVLVDGGFLEDTPLWFYVLKEAEVVEQGERLGPVGSRIDIETIIGQLRVDPTSFLNQGWDPSKGVTTDDGQQVEDITTFLRFAKMHP